MLLAIISAVFCLAVATMMYTPKMRVFKFYRPVAFLFLFEGIWLLLDYIFNQVAPDNIFMMIIHYIGLIVIGIYFLAGILIEAREKAKNKKIKNREDK